MADLRSPGVLDSPDALVRLARAGDETAFARIVRLHRIDMVRVCYVIAGDVDLAREGVATAWPIAWNQLGSLGDPTRLGPWLCAIAARETRDVVRYWSSLDAQEYRAEVDALGPRPGSSRPTADTGLAEILGRWPVEDRLVLALHCIAGLTPTELGRAIRSSPAEATTIARALVGRLELGLAGGRTGRRDLGAAVEERLRAYANVPVAHVNIDAVARVAKVTRHDGRQRLISVVLAAIVAALLTYVPPLMASGASTALDSGAATASPPAIDAGPGTIGERRNAP